jgi:hypothetical protein
MTTATQNATADTTEELGVQVVEDEKIEPTTLVTPEPEAIEITDEMLNDDLFLYNLVTKMMTEDKKEFQPTCRILSETYDVPYVVIKAAYGRVEDSKAKEAKKETRTTATKATTPKPLPDQLKAVTESCTDVRVAMGKLEGNIRSMWTTMQEWEAFMKAQSDALDVREAALIRREQDVAVMMENGAAWCGL